MEDAFEDFWECRKGLLELRRLLLPVWEGDRNGLEGTKLSGSEAKAGAGGARSRRVSGNSGSGVVSIFRGLRHGGVINYL